MKARRQRFIAAYLGEAAGNSAEAARLAGYSVHTARSAGSRLLTYADVRQEIDAAQQQLVKDSGFTAEQVITELATIARHVPEKITGNDKIKALELLGKAHGLFADKHDTNRVSVTIGFLTANLDDRSLNVTRRQSLDVETTAIVACEIVPQG